MAESSPEPLEGEASERQLNDLKNPTTIARICGLDECPKDKRGRALVSVKRKNVPGGVFGDDYLGVVHTPIAARCNEKGFVGSGRGRRGIDDHAYKNHPTLQRQIPRCYSILRIFRRDTGKCVGKFVVQGYYKFGGSSADEDSNISTKSLSQNTDKATRIVLSEKANGKAAVITMFKFNGESFVFGGSKGEHVVVRLKKYHDTIGYYDPTHFAYQILDCYHRLWLSMSKETRKILKNKLVGDVSEEKSEGEESSQSSEFDGYTICAEFEDGRHMVPLPEGQKDPILKIFGIIENRGEIDSADTLCTDVVPTLKFFESLGLPVIKYDIKSPEEVKRLKMQLRTGTMAEGFVLHYQMENENGEFVTLAIEKYKLWWYIILRVIREFLSHAHLQDGLWKKKLRSRINKRNRDFMNMPPNLTKEWIALAIEFCEWFIGSKRPKSDLDSINKGKGMGFVWRIFMKKHPFLNDNFKLDEFDKQQVESGKITFNENEDGEEKTEAAEPSPTKGVLVVFQGIPGIGKSHITDDLVKKMKSHGIASVGHEQDTYAARFGRKKAGRKCLEDCTKYFRKSAQRVVFLQRNNSTYQQFQRYAEAAKNNGWKVHVISPLNLLDEPLTALAAIQSVYQRSFKKDHPTFKSLSLTDQLQITFSFLTVFKFIELGQENVDACDKIPLVKKSENDADAKDEGDEDSSIPEECITFFNDYLKHFRAASNPWKAKAYDENRVKDGLKLDTFDYQKFRRTPDEIATDVCEIVTKAWFGENANGEK